MSFHVPEAARVVSGRLRSTFLDGHNGAFVVPSMESGWLLVTIASDGTDRNVPECLGWEHVSVRAVRGAKERTPSWKEMASIKDIFWDAEDVVMQLHPRRSQYVNNHPHVLHLWRSRTQPIPEPPAILVGTLVETS